MPIISLVGTGPLSTHVRLHSIVHGRGHACTRKAGEVLVRLRRELHHVREVGVLRRPLALRHPRIDLPLLRLRLQSRCHQGLSRVWKRWLRQLNMVEVVDVDTDMSLHLRPERVYINGADRGALRVGHGRIAQLLPEGRLRRHHTARKRHLHFSLRQIGLHVLGKSLPRRLDEVLRNVDRQSHHAGFVIVH